MKNTNKKGFTMVELVIVIAVVAILAAVLIPTFSNLIEKANQSADVQAVRQMNTILATSTENFYDIAIASAYLAENGLDSENYKPLSADMYFYWVKSINRVVLADADSNVVYPEEYANVKTGWFSLSTIVPVDDSWTENITNDATVTVESGAQLVSLINAYNDGQSDATAVQEIILSENVDLMGSGVNFSTVNSDLVIKGEGDTPVEISGIRSDSLLYHYTGDDKDMETKTYGYGLIGNVATGVTVTIENVTLSGLVSGDSEIHTGGTVGLIAGYVNGELIMNNVTIKDSRAFGHDKVGGIVGQLLGTLTMNNVDFENVTVVGTCHVAKIAGVAGTYSNLSVDENCDFSGITTRVNDTAWINAVNKEANLNPGWSAETYKGIYGTYSTYSTSSASSYYAGATDNWYWLSKTKTTESFDNRGNAVYCSYSSNLVAGKVN